MGILVDFTVPGEGVRLNASVPVRVERLRVSEPVRPHDHTYHEICIVEAGTAEHRADGGTTRLEAGDAIVMGPGDAHAFDSPRGLKVTNVYYLPEAMLEGAAGSLGSPVPLLLMRHLFPGAARGARVLRLAAAERRAVAADLADAAGEMRMDPPSTLFLRAVLMKVLVRLDRAAARAGVSAEPADPRVAVMLGAIERIISAGEVFSIGAVAQVAGLSSDHATRLFRAATGESPMAHYQRRRAQRAGLLLLDRRLSITAVANRLGYTDGAHFSRCFREHHALSPREYRDKHLD